MTTATLQFPAIADCGSTMTVRVRLTETERCELVGRNIVVDGGLTALTNDRYTTLLGQWVDMRTPMYCGLPQGICIACVGEAVHSQLRHLAALPPMPPDLRLLHERAANRETAS